MIGLRRFGPLLAVGLLLAAAAVAAMLASPQLRPMQQGERPTPGAGPTFDLREPSEPPLAIPTQIPQNERQSIHLPGWLLVAAQALCVLIVLAGVGVLVWYLLRNGLRLRERRHEVEPAPAPVPAREQVIAAVEAGLSELDDADADPRRAVIACWVRLEQAAAAAGTPRHVGDTPTELVTRLLTGHAVSAPVLYLLAEVYREARYATHRVDIRTRDQARAALRQLREELSRERAAVP
jgi:hypothetical protein